MKSPPPPPPPDLSPSPSRRTLDWVVCLSGAVVYTLLLPFFVQTYRLSLCYYPLRIRYPELTMVAFVGGLLWFAAQIVERQLRLQDDVLEPSTVNCWLFSFMRYLGMAIFANALLCKQYRMYKKYVAVEQAPQSWLIILALCIPFIVFMSVPASGVYNGPQVDTTGVCGTPNLMWKIVSVYIAALCLPFAVMLRSLSDPCCYFPNFTNSCIEFAGCLVVSITFVTMGWGTDSTTPPEVITTVHSLLGTLVVPVTLFLVVVAEPLYKWWRNDLQYLREIESKMRVNIRLPVAYGSSVEPFAGIEAFFEVERLASHVESGDLEIIKKWLAQTNLSNVNAHDKEGLTPLHRAVRNCNIQVTELLLDMEANPNAVSADGQCPIHLASRRGSSDMIFMLHQYGADVNATTTSGVTALHIAIEYKQMGAISTLLRLGSNASSNRNVPGGDGAAVEVASRGGWDWKEVHMNGRGWMRDYLKTPFVLACELGYKEIVSFLLETTDLSNVQTENAPCKHGLTPVLLCAALGHVSLVEFLLGRGEHRVSVDYENPKDKRNVFHYTCMQGQLEVLKVLLSHFTMLGAAAPCGSVGRRDDRRSRGAKRRGQIQPTSPQIEDLSSQDTTLQNNCVSNASVTITDTGGAFGVATRRRAQLDSLLNAQDYLGRTPLHYAVLGGHIQVVRALLGEKVDTSIVDGLGSIPKEGTKPPPRQPSTLDIASQIPSPQLRNQDDLEVLDETMPCKGLSPVEYAHHLRDVQMVKVFLAASGY